ncbi:hypothetical protein BZG36_01983 [Bifiguratus adelaidae]|uniref:Uncharacterized protein n=1 Tax=Bifiguratus adelaidae TaxID=1938954 RepID=A0A261Y464_9FUNG|nr:hypothetical protein BZG36_01983 [Bifiguratus adelaidae]
MCENQECPYPFPASPSEFVAFVEQKPNKKSPCRAAGKARISPRKPREQQTAKRAATLSSPIPSTFNSPPETLPHRTTRLPRAVTAMSDHELSLTQGQTFQENALMIGTRSADTQQGPDHAIGPISYTYRPPCADSTTSLLSERDGYGQSSEFGKTGKDPLNEGVRRSDGRDAGDAGVIKKRRIDLTDAGLPISSDEAVPDLLEGIDFDTTSSDPSASLCTPLDWSQLQELMLDPADDGHPSDEDTEPSATVTPSPTMATVDSFHFDPSKGNDDDTNNQSLIDHLQALAADLPYSIGDVEQINAL